MKLKIISHVRFYLCSIKLMPQHHFPIANMIINNPLLKIIRISLFIAVWGSIFIFSQSFSQTSDNTNSKNNFIRQKKNNVREKTNDDVIKKKSGSEEEVIKILKKGNKFGKVNDSEDVEPPIISLSSKSIDATIVKGNILTYPITIENSGSSALKWEITVQGISGALISAMVGKRTSAGSRRRSSLSDHTCFLSTPATSALPSTADITTPMSVFDGFTSEAG